MRHGFRLLQVNEGGEVRDLLTGELEGRHPLVGAPMQHDIPDLVSAYVCGDQLGPGEVGTCFPAPGVTAVTKRAILLEEGTAGGSRRIGRVGCVTPMARSCILRCGRRLAGSSVDVQLPPLVGGQPCYGREQRQLPKLFHLLNTTFAGHLVATGHTALAIFLDKRH